MITYLKKDGKDLFKLNEVCKGWNSRTDSDGNPISGGLRFEKGSDENPTYSNSYSNSKKNDSKKEKNDGSFTLEEAILFAKDKGYNAEFAKKFYNYYAQNNFRDRDNKLVKSWKGRMNSWITREDNNNFKINDMGRSTEYDGVFYHEASGKYWKEFVDGKKYVCQQRGTFEYNNDGTKILFEI